ncbi:MAG: DNA-processing protein DprA [Raoultibacter sp.]
MSDDLTLKQSEKMHQKEGFSRYRGPKLKGVRTELTWEEKEFPEPLMHIPQPPKHLYVIGNTEALTEGLAVVGARKATPYGKACAEKFAGIAAARGIVIISGGARGCDARAHRAALDSGGKTVVILGGGCDEIYPAENFGLFQDVIEGGGAIVSEQPWEFPPLRHTFRARNRLIAGLSRATLIVEAGLPSGTFSTADEALAASKEVLVVPGSIISPTSRGANRLLYQGATPVVDTESFEDILSGLFGCLKQEEYIQGGHDVDDDLLCMVYAMPMNQEEILTALKTSSKMSKTSSLVEVTVRLATLQQEGKITRFPDGRFGPARV